METRESTPRDPSELERERFASADGVRPLEPSDLDLRRATYVFPLPPADEYLQRLGGMGTTVPLEPAAADRRRLSGSIASTARTRRTKS